MSGGGLEPFENLFGIYSKPDEQRQEKMFKKSSVIYPRSFPELPKFVKPGKRALHDPPLWQDGKDMQFIALDYLNFRARKGLDRVCKCFRYNIHLPGSF